MLTAAPERYYFANRPQQHDPAALADYRRCVRDPATVHAMCEDYRAGAGIDQQLDEADLASGHRIHCPVLALWSAREELPRWFDVLDVWRRWASDVRGRGIDAGHYLAEEAPEEVTEELLGFFASAG